MDDSVRAILGFIVGYAITLVGMVVGQLMWERRQESRDKRNK